MSRKYDVRLSTSRPGSLPAERIIEFSTDKTTEHQGGLISFWVQPDGKLRITIYRLNPDIRVDVSGEMPNGTTTFGFTILNGEIG